MSCCITLIMNLKAILGVPPPLATTAHSPFKSLVNWDRVDILLVNIGNCKNPELWANLCDVLANQDPGRLVLFHLKRGFVWGWAPHTQLFVQFSIAENQLLNALFTPISTRYRTPTTLCAYFYTKEQPRGSVTAVPGACYFIII